MGIVVDPKVAEDRRIPCHGYTYDGKRLLWKKGVIGTLDDVQEAKFCDLRIADIKPLTPKLMKRFEIMRGLEEGYPYCIPKRLKTEIESILKEKGATIESIRFVEKFPECE